MWSYLYKNLNYILPTAFFLLAGIVLLVRGTFTAFGVWEISRAGRPLLYWTAALGSIAMAVLGLYVMLGARYLE